jgi:hypothetical protein
MRSYQAAVRHADRGPEPRIRRTARSNLATLQRRLKQGRERMNEKTQPQEREHSDGAAGTRDRLRRRDRLRGHPQEGQPCSAAVFGGTRDRVPPARSTI